MDQPPLDSHGRHCPFLNRADARCARHFSLEQLQHTFDHCFGQYETCGVYLELLYERRLRRAAARIQHQLICGTGELSTTIPGDAGDANHTDPDLVAIQPDAPARRPASPARGPVVQLTVAGRQPAVAR